MTGPNSRRVTIPHADLVGASERLKAGDTLRVVSADMGVSYFCLRAKLVEANLYPDFSLDSESSGTYKCPQCRRFGEKAEGTALCRKCAPKHNRLKPGMQSREEESKYKGFDPFSQKFLMMRLVP